MQGLAYTKVMGHEGGDAVMKLIIALLGLMLLGSGGCAHNPRPESPEQRAEKQAQSLQAQQDDQAGPRTAQYSTRDEDPSQEGSDTEAQSQPRQPARTDIRRQTTAIRSSIPSVRVPTGVTGGLFR